MGENYVDLMWRVMKHGQLVAAFLDLDQAQEYAKKIVGGEVIVLVGKPVTQK